MSSEDDNSGIIYSSLEEEAAEQEEQKRKRWEKFNEEENRKLVEKGGTPLEEKDPLGNVDPITRKSYEDLGLDMPDDVELASSRPGFRMKHRLQQLGKFKSFTVIPSIYRLIDEKGKEWLCHSSIEYFKTYNNQDVMSIENKSVGASVVVFGTKKYDVNANRIGSVMEGKRLKFTIPFSKDNLTELFKVHDEGIKGLKDKNWNLRKQNFTNFPYMIVGVCGTRASSLTSKEHKTYSIMNRQDFTNGTHKQLTELGQRALSTDKPSLDKLRDNVIDDPVTSELRMMRYGRPSATFQQGSYH